MIESLHSPHISRVKALIGSKGVKERKATGEFVAEGIQCVREAISTKTGPQLVSLYATSAGLLKLVDFDLHDVDVVEVSDPVMEAMATTVTPQGILAICKVPHRSISELKSTGSLRIIYLNEIQDPGNAGTILRSADAMGIDAVVTSPGSVDMFSPKVVRSTAGSLWHIDLFEGIPFLELSQQIPGGRAMLLSSHAHQSILDVEIDSDCIAIFGNEARGVAANSLESEIAIEEITIPMAGRAESLNLSAAASIVMFTLTSGLTR